VFMIMLVLDDVNRLDDVLAAWARAGAIGVTAIEGAGAHQGRSALGLVHARRNIENLGIETERANFTLFGIASDAVTADRCLAATESVVGNLVASGAGIWAAWPLALVKGLPPRRSDSGVT
jgi:hypothetical protein